jgi:hypothetical protein
MEHADKVSPDGIFVEVFGERKELKPNMGTFLRFQQKSGLNPFDVRIWARPSPLDIVTLIWAGIGGEACGRTVEEVADGLSFESIEGFNETLNKFFKKGEVPEPPKSDAAAE